MGKQLYEIRLDPTTLFDSEAIWDLLSAKGIEPLYSVEEEEITLVFAYLQKELTPSKVKKELPLIATIKPVTLCTIDWESQWREHGKGFYDNLLHVDLKDYISSTLIKKKYQVLKLTPGPGFGDLSHPTTALVLKLMDQEIKGQYIIDVGCGSGILSLAAFALKAKSIFGLDIDKLAIEHSKENVILNGMQKGITIETPDEFMRSLPKNSSFIILMNMIESESRIALDSLKMILPHVKMMITSGSLVEHKSAYIKWLNSLGFKPIQTLEQNGWIGIKSKPC